MNNDKLLKLLQNLLKLPKETEWIEFKEARSTFDKDEIGKYNSALSNEANLRMKDYGWLVFGVSDDKQILGSNYRLNNLHDIKYEIYQNTNLSLKEVYEVEVENNRVVLFQISPAQKGQPTKWKGQPYGRESDSLIPLSDEKYQSILNQVENRNWLSFYASYRDQSVFSTQEVISLLDYESYFRLLKLPLPTSFELILEKLSDENFIVKEDNQYKITNLGALLFAKDMRIFGDLQYKLPRVITYSGNNKLSGVIKDQSGVKGYASGFEGLIDYVFSQIPELETIEKVRSKKRNYPVLTVREFVANSLIHQDLTLGTKPIIEIYTDRIEISNGGSCLFDPSRIIDHVPTSRNEVLAEKMRVLNICEKRGSGVDRAIQAVEEMQLPAPKFVNQPNGFKSIIYQYKKYADLSDEEKLRACYQHVCLNYETGRSTTNESLRERFEISKKSASMMSRLINKAIEKDLIKKFDPSNSSLKMVKYIPFYA
jgi:ATP-dependent DNA helicase RecG